MMRDPGHPELSVSRPRVAAWHAASRDADRPTPGRGLPRACARDGDGERAAPKLRSCFLWGNVCGAGSGREKLGDSVRSSNLSDGFQNSAACVMI